MAILASDSGNGDFEKTPLGNQQAVCAFVEDIGTHRGEYQGVPNERHQIVICWELKAKMKDGDNAGKPFMVPKFYTLSLSEKANLRKDLESWRGRAFTAEQLKGFDVEVLKGVNCLINVIEYTKHSGDKGTKVASISPMVEGMEKIDIINQTPPEWIAKKRAESIEYSESGDSWEPNENAQPEQDEF